jgi:preprotein translocase subunit SecF
MVMRGFQFIPAGTKIDFMGFRWWGFIFSGGLTVLSILFLLFQGLNFGIDFRGGILIEVRGSGPVDLAAMRAKISGLNLGDHDLQGFGQSSDVLIRVQQQIGGEQAQLQAVEKVKQALGAGYDYRRVEYVGPKVGGELIRGGLIATALALLSILVYVWFRFEWQFGVCGVLTLLHDVITTLGVFSITQYDFNLTTVAAVLTIAGYSINDTVVVYDRIRENLRKYKKMPLVELFNRSLNETLSRTIMTSTTTLLALIALFVFGGEVISTFAIAMIWGVVVGTYSTAIISTAVLIYLPPRRPGTEDDEAKGAAGQKA